MELIMNTIMKLVKGKIKYANDKVKKKKVWEFRRKKEGGGRIG